MPAVAQQTLGLDRTRAALPSSAIARARQRRRDGATWRGRLFYALVAAAIASVGVVGGAIVAVAGWDALALCAALVGCAFILVDFRIGAVLLILLMPISRSYLFPHAMLGITGLNPANLLLMGTLASYLLRALTGGSLHRFLPPQLFWLYLLPITVGAVLGSQHVGEIYPGFFSSNLLDFRDSAGYVSEMLVKPLLLVAFGLLVGAAVAHSRRPERFLVPLLISIWIMGLIVIVFVSQSGIALNDLASSESREFLSSLGLHANELGHLYAVAFALLLFTWVEATEPGLRVALVASMGMVLGALLLTFSRSAFVGVIIVSVLFLLWHRSVKTLIAGALVVLAGLLLMPDAVSDRAATGFGEGLNAITAGRLDGLWLPLLPQVLESPIYGSGLGSILWSHAMRTGADSNVLFVTHPHSAYLEAALDVGLVGLFLICAYFVHVWRGFRRLAADPTLSPTLRGFFLGAAAGLLGLLIADVVDSSLAPRSEQVFLWFAIGMMYGQHTRPNRGGGGKALLAGRANGRRRSWRG